MKVHRIGIISIQPWWRLYSPNHFNAPAQSQAESAEGDRAIRAWLQGDRGTATRSERGKASRRRGFPCDTIMDERMLESTSTHPIVPADARATQRPRG